MTSNPALTRGTFALCAWLALAGCGMKADLHRPEEAKARNEKRSKGLGRSFFGYTSTGGGAADDAPPLQRPVAPPQAQDAPAAASESKGKMPSQTPTENVTPLPPKP